MMRAWVARHADKSRMRIQLEPFDRVLWRGWEIRSGGLTDEEWTALGTETDTVLIEKMHQDIWARWK
jgi:hypothetical protein